MAIFSAIDTGSAQDTFYEGMVKDAANWAILEAALSGATTTILVGGGAGVVPVLTTATGSGAPVRATSPTLVTPVLGTPSSGTLTSCTGLPQAGIVPGTAENDFLVAGSTPFSFAKKTLAATKTLLHAAPSEIGGTTPAAGSFTTLKQTTGAAAGAMPISDAVGAFTLTAATGSGSPVRATSPALITPALGTPTALVVTNVCDMAAPPAIGGTTPAAIHGTTGGFSGNVTPDLLTASKPVFSDASKNLVSTGTMPLNQGGTGATSAASAFTALKQNATTAVTGVASFPTAYCTLTSGAMTFKDNLTQHTEFIPIEWCEDGTTAPDTQVLLEHTNGAVRIRKFSGTASQDVRIPWYVPTNITAASGITFQVVCAVSEATGLSSEGVSFKISGYSIGDGDNITGTFGDEVESKKTAVTYAQYIKFNTVASSAVTVTNLAGGELAMLKLYRDHDDTDDDYAQKIGVVGVLIHYE